MRCWGQPTYLFVERHCMTGQQDMYEFALVPSGRRLVATGVSEGSGGVGGVGWAGCWAAECHARGISDRPTEAKAAHSRRQRLVVPGHIPFTAGLLKGQSAVPHAAANVFLSQHRSVALSCFPASHLHP